MTHWGMDIPQWVKKEVNLRTWIKWLATTRTECRLSAYSGQLIVGIYKPLGAVFFGASVVNG
jgi:hypothetical protein